MKKHVQKAAILFLMLLLLGPILPHWNDVQAAKKNVKPTELNAKFTKIETGLPNKMTHIVDSATNKKQYAGIFMGDEGTTSIITTKDYKKFKELNFSSQLEAYTGVHTDYEYYQVECYNNVYYFLAYYRPEKEELTKYKIVGFTTKDLKKITPFTPPTFDERKDASVPYLSKIGENFVYTCNLDLTESKKATGYFYIGKSMKKLKKVSFPSMTKNKLYKKYKKLTGTALFCYASCSPNGNAITVMYEFSPDEQAGAVLIAQSSDSKKWSSFKTFDNNAYALSGYQTNGFYVVSNQYTDNDGSDITSTACFCPS